MMSSSPRKRRTTGWSSAGALALVTEDLDGSIAFHDGGGTTAVITVPHLESLRT